MTINDFLATLPANTPPAASVYLQALWYDAKGDWNKAHQLVQDLPDKTASHIHAYLHRKEGDEWNAGYWYQKAGTSVPDYALDVEWTTIVKDLL